MLKHIIPLDLVCVTFNQPQFISPSLIKVIVYNSKRLLKICNLLFKKC